MEEWCWVHIQLSHPQPSIAQPSLSVAQYTQCNLHLGALLMNFPHNFYSHPSTKQVGFTSEHHLFYKCGHIKSELTTT